MTGLCFGARATNRPTVVAFLAQPRRISLIPQRLNHHRYEPPFPDCHQGIREHSGGEMRVDLAHRQVVQALPLCSFGMGVTLV